MAARQPRRRSPASERRYEYPSLGHDGVVLVHRLIEETTNLPPVPSSDQVVAAYSAVLNRLYAHLALLVGSRGAEAIAQRAVKNASATAPLLSRAQVRESGLTLGPLEGESVGGEDLRRSAEHLLLSMTDVLASLVGADLLAALLQRMTQSAAGGAG